MTPEQVRRATDVLLSRDILMRTIEAARTDKVWVRTTGTQYNLGGADKEDFLDFLGKCLARYDAELRSLGVTVTT